MNLYALNGRFVFLNHLRHISSYKIEINYCLIEIEMLF
jgi:hypothetical protein